MLTKYRIYGREADGGGTQRATLQIDFNTGLVIVGWRETDELAAYENLQEFALQQALEGIAWQLEDGRPLKELL